MQRFFESEDGAIHETSVRATVARLQELFPEIDALSLEAHIVFERTHNLLLNMREAAWASFGLTGRRFILLRLLYTSDRRRLSMGEIASQMNLGTNNVTQLVDGMERDGLVERGADPADARAVLAMITAEGLERLTTIRAARAAIIERRLAELEPEDRDALAAAIPALAKLTGEAV